MPIADAGRDQNILVGELVLLDGSNSVDPDGNQLIFNWKIEAKPAQSQAKVLRPNTMSPSIYVDFVGEYLISLTVNDGITNSLVDEVLIIAENGARNVILMIGDGMGSAQIRAAGMYLNGTDGSLSFESFTSKGFVETANASGAITDSAAAATAMATGVKVNNGVISQRIPGDGTNLETILELAKSLGLSTGLLTTTNISHATPAAFASHTSSRNLYTEIINEYLSFSMPDVLMGGAQFVDPASANAVGYIVVENMTQLKDLNIESSDLVWGQFGENHLPYESDKIDIFPSLSESVSTALDILDNNPKGFFLMIEGGRIDHAGHENNIISNISETIEFANAVEKVINWSNGKKNTLIIVTADHETGGLEILNNNGMGNYPTVKWNTTGHTLTNVPIFSRGINENLLSGIISNTTIYDVMRFTISEE